MQGHAIACDVLIAQPHYINTICRCAWAAFKAIPHGFEVSACETGFRGRQCSVVRKVAKASFIVS